MKTQSTKLHPGTIEKIEEYQEQEGISKSEALRRLITDGLEAQGPDTGVNPLTVPMMMGFLFIGGAFTTTSATAGAVGILLVVAPTVLMYLPEPYRPDVLG